MESGWQTTERYFHDYLVSCGKSAATTKTYIANLRQFWAACGARDGITPYEGDRRICRAYIAERIATVSSSRAFNELSALKLFYRYLIETKAREDDPTEGIRVKRTKGLPTKPLLNNEIEQLLAACTGERDRLIVMMLAATGARISELAGMSAGDIDWAQGLVLIHGKGGKDRLVAPRADVLGRLHAFLGTFPAGPLWLSKVQLRALSEHQLRKILYEVAIRAGVMGVHPHRLRASFATAYLGEHPDIQALQGMMGHESIETTSRYTEFTRLKRGLEQMRSMTRFGPETLY